ncbi:glycosyltransferase [Thermoflavifilum thermophilum]|uniref:Glycosyltransferase, catalytic subunit of cellulose synthase and poly-beta-1,6-N-acetylglucosamine synthase n=1 Tax=Thermoflavifilum thermophilum TaxID=1393122 RepID=A0A1I7NET0_9BACT|nr:glycosyltransferase [Thermoflavifilum thermophilum]SFV33093.1 Glycosyltransferase, catalytic subunit of cellulose synthase and poly-beta-1,6-N-acetylglucosamine synthase [Thermoflavifilum thermophilum]
MHKFSRFASALERLLPDMPPIDVSLLIWIGFLLVAGLQLFYYLFFFRRLAFYKTDEAIAQIPNSFPLSIIICARDAEHLLRKNMHYWLQQRYLKAEGTPNYELLIVDHCSEDDTARYVHELAGAYPHLRLIRLYQHAKGIPGKKFPLSIGIKSAAYEHVLLTDADCRPASVWWAARMSQGFQPGKEIVLGYGAYEKQPGWLNKVIRYDAFFSALQYLSFALAGYPYMGVGRNLAYQKALFFRHKGFVSHQHIPSGDDDLFVNQAANRRNVAVVLHPDAFTYTPARNCWKSWWMQKKRHLTTGKYYRRSDQLRLGLYAASHIGFYGLLLLTLLLPPAHLPPVWFWGITLGVVLCRWMIQHIILRKSMKVLQEHDLKPYYLLFDIAYCLYYLIFTPLAFKRKVSSQWS